MKTNAACAGGERAARSGRRDLRFLREARLRAFARGARGATQPLVECRMRGAAVVLLMCGALGAAAQDKIERFPEPPPPPPMPESDEPAVRIPVQEGDKVEEIREGGRIVMLRVTPPGGRPYYLVDTTGNGNWMRRDALDDGVRVPMWPVYTFE